MRRIESSCSLVKEGKSDSRRASVVNVVDKQTDGVKANEGSCFV